jgi:PAS domain S-box-containing protein
MIFINLLPFIPLSIKGILGLAFIIISSIKLNLKEALITTFVLISLQTVSFILDYRIDYEQRILTMFLGTIVYLLLAYFLGTYAEKNRNMIQELQIENKARKNIEIALNQQIALQNGVMNTVPIPLFFKDLKFKYYRINQAFTDLFAIKEEDIIGKNVYAIYDFSTAEICHQMDENLLTVPGQQAKEISVSNGDGETKHYIINKALIKDNKGNPSGIVGAVLDITKQIESEKLKNNIAELQKEEKLKNEFFSNISHELRTPLNVIYSAVQLVEMSIDNDNNITREKMKKNVYSIKQNSLRLQRLVNNILDLTKIDSKAVEMKLQNLDIVFVIEEITLSVADFISNKGISLVFDTNVEELVMAFDEEKIERIILNLLSNAIKHTPDGGTITVSLTKNADNIIIRVEDSGIGIPDNKLDLIFKRFYQISPVNTRLHEGSGIGLNLVKSLVEMHQGEITVSSILGKGTIFSIRLPIKKIKNSKLKISSSDKHSRIELIRLEFSDIYTLNKMNHT